jgi:hypothetical protein
MSTPRKGRTAREFTVTAGPSQEGGKVDTAPRNCAGKVEHKYIAEKMLEAGIAAFGNDTLQFGKLQQALTYAGRLAKANWRQYVAEQQGREAA